MHSWTYKSIEERWECIFALKRAFLPTFFPDLQIHVKCILGSEGPSSGAPSPAKIVVWVHLVAQACCLNCIQVHSEMHARTSLMQFVTIKCLCLSLIPDCLIQPVSNREFRFEDNGQVLRTRSGTSSFTTNIPTEHCALGGALSTHSKIMKICIHDTGVFHKQSKLPYVQA